MAATTFPRFSELPKNIQERIWRDALNLISNLRMLKEVSLRAETWYRGNAEPHIEPITDQHLRPIIDSGTKHTLFVNAAWFRSAWWSVMSTSLQARKIALQRLAEVVEEERRLRYVSAHKGDLLRLLKAAINDLNARLSQ